MENQEQPKMQEVKQLRLVDERNVQARENEGWKKTGNVTGSLVEMEYTKEIPAPEEPSVESEPSLNSNEPGEVNTEVEAGEGSQEESDEKPAQ